MAGEAAGGTHLLVCSSESSPKSCWDCAGIPARQPWLPRLIEGLEMNPTLPLIKCQGGKTMCRVIRDKTAPS